MENARTDKKSLKQICGFLGTRLTTDNQEYVACLTGIVCSCSERIYAEPGKCDCARYLEAKRLLEKS